VPAAEPVVVGQTPIVGDRVPTERHYRSEQADLLFLMMRSGLDYCMEEELNLYQVDETRIPLAIL
jgi:hypothetical protein